MRTHPLWNALEPPSMEAINVMIDVDLTVTDSADEDAWPADLESAGFVLRSRIPDWEHHRILRGENPTTNLHEKILAADCRHEHDPTRGRKRHSA